jgi:hypothetical protein
MLVYELGATTLDMSPPAAESPSHTTDPGTSEPATAPDLGTAPGPSPDLGTAPGPSPDLGTAPGPGPAPEPAIGGITAMLLALAGLIAAISGLITAIAGLMKVMRPSSP